MRKHCGHSITEYSIIITLVALALVAVFYLLGAQIVSIFTSYSTSYDSMATSARLNLNDNTSPLTPGSLKGTNISPVMNCNAGNCAIDYGDVILTGVPEDWGGFIETAGTSGGTDKLLSLVEQLADQLENNGDSKGAAEYRDLANLGHFVASIQKQLEDIANTCSSHADPANCFNDNTKLGGFEKLPLPDNISSYMTKYNVNNYNLAFLAQQCSVEEAKYDQIYETNDWNAHKDYFPSYHMVEIFDSIMSNPGYSPAMKEITKELYLNINELSVNIASQANTMQTTATFGPTGKMSWKDYDPLTGEKVGTFFVDKTADLSVITTPQISAGSNLNSLLICATGKFDDKGNACK